MNRLWLLLPLLALGACDKEKDVDPPAELVKLEPKIGVDKMWSTGVGGGTKALRLGLRPVVEGDRVYVAGHEGDIVALDKKNGRVQWRVESELPLSGGPGVGADRVVVGSNEGDVLALSAVDGKELWRVDVNGEVLSAPAVGQRVAVVRTVDGRLRGLSLHDGSELWVVEQQVPRLSLRGTAAPEIAGDLVLCGFDNGKVLAVGLNTGDVAWETAVAPSRGKTELERLVDIDSRVRVIGNDVFVVGFQGRAAMLALESGQIWWAHDESSDRGLAVSEEAIVGSAANGDVKALRRRDGSPLWQQPALHRRGLSGPAIDGNTIVVGDFEGYLHWLDAATGEIVARESTDGDRITNAPVVADGVVYVLTDSGTLAAFRREQPEPAPAAPG